MNKDTNLTPIKIEHSILAEWGKPLRCGDTAEWHSHGPYFGRVVLELKAPKEAWKAEKINGEWFWVCGCPDCLGEKGNLLSHKCDEHDVCVQCGTHRSELKEMPWAHEDGFLCKACECVTCQGGGEIAPDAECPDCNGTGRCTYPSPNNDTEGGE